MAEMYQISSDTLTEFANEARRIDGASTKKLTPGEMIDIFRTAGKDSNNSGSGNTGGEVTLQNKTITENGTYTADSGYDGLSKVVVDVQPKLQNKTVTENGEVSADSNYDGLSKVIVNVKPILEDITIVENGTYSASNGCYGLGNVTVAVIDKRIDILEGAS